MASISATTRLSKRVHRIGVPTLLVWGESDRLFPPDPYARIWLDAVDGSQLVTFAEAGHMVPVEQAAAVAEAITSFST